MTLNDIIEKYSLSNVERLTVNEAKSYFDVCFENIMDDCLEHEIYCPNYDVCFGIWCGV